VLVVADVQRFGWFQRRFGQALYSIVRHSLDNDRAAILADALKGNTLDFIEMRRISFQRHSQGSRAVSNDLYPKRRKS
jgi:hypothetical protein